MSSDTRVPASGKLSVFKRNEVPQQNPGWVKAGCGCHPPRGPTQGTEPAEERAPGTQAGNVHKEQLCRVCQRGEDTVSPVAPGDSGKARGDITGRRCGVERSGTGRQCGCSGPDMLSGRSGHWRCPAQCHARTRMDVCSRSFAGLPAAL